MLGDLPKEDLTAWDQLLYDFHIDENLQDEVDDVLRSAQHYLNLRTPGAHGQSYVAARNIPKLTRFCYYSGVLATPAPAAVSNHRITMGEGTAGFRYPVEIDGCTTKNAVGDAGTLGLLQMVNHSCNPNCKIVLVQTHTRVLLNCWFWKR